MSPHASESLIAQIKSAVPPVDGLRAKRATEEPPEPAAKPSMVATPEPPARPGAPLRKSRTRLDDVVTVPAKKPKGARKRCSFDIDAELAERAKVLCAIKGIEQRALVEAFFTAFVEENEDKLP